MKAMFIHSIFAPFKMFSKISALWLLNNYYIKRLELMFFYIYPDVPLLTDKFCQIRETKTCETQSPKCFKDVGNGEKIRDEEENCGKESCYSDLVVVVRL